MTRLPREGVTRVMLLGASELFGLYENPGNKLSDQLQEMLPDGYEVINASLFGMSLPRIKQLYQSYLRQFQPRISVVYPNPMFYLERRPPSDRSTGLRRRSSSLYSNHASWTSSRMQPSSSFPIGYRFVLGYL